MGNRIKTSPEIQIRNSLPESWTRKLIELARNYPYEKNRKKLQGLDLPRQVKASLYGNEDSRFITASLQNQPVGLIKISPSPLHSQILNQEIYSGSWELIKENDNDIRREIFKKLRNCYPEARVNFQQPEPNQAASRLLEEMKGYQKITREFIMYRTLDEKLKTPGTPGQKLKLAADPGEINNDRLGGLISYYNQGHLFDFPAYPADKVQKIYWKWLGAIRKNENSHEIILIHNNDKIAGYCLVKTTNSPFLNINSGTVSYLQVHPDFKNQGLGSFLLRRGLALLNKKNIKYVELKTSQKNRAAVNFYHKFGFETIARRIHFSLLPAG